MKKYLLLPFLAVLNACTSVINTDDELLGPLTLTQRVMVQESQTATTRPSSEHVVVNALAPDAHRYTADSSNSRIYKEVTDLNLIKWIVFEKPQITPTKIESIAGVGIQDGLLQSVYFDLNKDEIKQPNSLNQLAVQLNRISGKINVFGFSDQTGPEKNNLQLSKKRAEAVVQALVELGIDKKRLIADEGGISRLYADNARNRRASIFLDVESTPK